jgi:hypothetical protein
MPVTGQAIGRSAGPCRSRSTPCTTDLGSSALPFPLRRTRDRLFRASVPAAGGWRAARRGLSWRSGPCGGSLCPHRAHRARSSRRPARRVGGGPQHRQRPRAAGWTANCDQSQRPRGDAAAAEPWPAVLQPGAAVARVRADADGACAGGAQPACSLCRSSSLMAPQRWLRPLTVTTRLPGWASRTGSRRMVSAKCPGGARPSPRRC